MVFNSYYLQPVNVAVLRNERVPPSGAPSDDDVGWNSKPPIVMYDREVTMSIAGHLCCKATSTVRVYDEDLVEMLKEFGIGQLLRKKNLLPNFTLHDAGRADHGGMWRFYSMTVPDMIEFDILEDHPSNAFNLPILDEPSVPNPSHSHDEKKNSEG